MTAHYLLQPQTLSSLDPVIAGYSHTCYIAAKLALHLQWQQVPLGHVAAAVFLGKTSADNGPAERCPRSPVARPLGRHVQ